MNNQNPPFEFDGRKKLVVEMIANGKPLKQVAHDLKMTQRGVVTILKKLRKRYNCVNTLQLVVYCIENNLIRKKDKESSQNDTINHAKA